MTSLTYATVTTLGDFGPWISKIILDLPHDVRAGDIAPDAFSAFCARRRRDGTIVMRKEKGSRVSLPSQGYIGIIDAYPCDEQGHRLAASSHVALETSEERLTKCIEGGVLGSQYVDCDITVTQVREISVVDGPVPLSGLVFDELRASLCPALERWNVGEMAEPIDGVSLKYGYFEPDFSPADHTLAGPFAKPAPRPQKAALLVYLHGAGEGTGETTWEGPERAYTGNRVTALSQNPIQGYFGGAAWVLAPQCPTFWMDDGVEQMGRSNRSIYVSALKALIDGFIAEHADRIDTNRIVIAGLSNGGFMTVRMCLDYPDFFAAGLPCCAPFFTENQTSQAISALAKTPLWFIHSKGDELVDPSDTTLPLYHKLVEAGTEVHMTYFDHVEDLTGRYRESDGSPKKTFNHGVWIHQFNDFCRTDLDGTNVLVNGEPVSCWEWAAAQRR